jgi:hypothetical protein
VLGFRLGTPLFGAGKSEVQCSSSIADLCDGTTSSGYDERSPIILGFEGLTHVTRALRLGIGYTLVPYSGMRLDGADETTHLGNAHRFSAIFEGVLALRGSSKLALRVQGGLGVLLTGGDLEEERAALLRTCEGATVGFRCVTEPGPFFGGTYGVGTSYLVGNDVRWRFDVTLDRYVQPIREIELHQSADRTHLEQTLSGTRLALSAGVEL